jgi:hypothetical protein
MYASSDEDADDAAAEEAGAAGCGAAWPACRAGGGAASPDSGRGERVRGGGSA